MLSVITGIIIFIVILIPSIPFYRLAKSFGKPKLLYGIIGFLAFFLSMFIPRLIMNLILLLWFGIDEPNVYLGASLNGLINIVLGTIGCTLTYFNLRKKWEAIGSKINPSQEDILDM